MKVMTGEKEKSLSEPQQRLASQILEIGGVKFGDYKIKLHDKHPEAPLSPIYIDLRLLRRFPDAKRATVDAYEELLTPLKFDLLADVPTAATPLVSSLSDRLQIGMITPRADTKAYGSGAKVDGMLPSDKGKVAVLIDDLVTAADSKIEAAHTLRAAEIVVTDVVVLIDREQGGREQLATEELKLHSAFTMKKMLQFYLNTGRITDKQFHEVFDRLATLNKFLKAIAS